MAVIRETPYNQFNFLVDLGDGVTEGVQAGFSEISGVDTVVDVIEYRSGNTRENTVTKIPGLSKHSNVTLKRGLVGSLALYQWLNDVRNGSLATRTVTIQLLNEDRSQVVQTWTLLRVRIIKHVSGPLNARGTDVAMEEMVLAYERLEME